MTRALLTLALASLVLTASETQAGTTSPAPRAPHVYGLAPAVGCTSANRMDVFIDEDNIMWECVCEWLMTGNICRWQVIGGVDPVAERRIRGKIAAHALPRRFWYHARSRYLTVLR